MPGRLITEFNNIGFVQSTDYLPLARGTTTYKISAGSFLTKGVDGSVQLGAAIATGLGVTTLQDCSIELGALRTVAGNAYVDLHSSVGSDYDARFAKLSGINGDFILANRGTGTFNISQEGNGPINISTNANTRIYITSDGKTGFGTTSPLTKLHVVGDESNSALNLDTTQGIGYSGVAGSVINFRQKGSAGYTKSGDEISSINSVGWSSSESAYKPAASIKTIATGNFNSSTTYHADVAISTVDHGSFTEKFRIKSDGRVGIGTNNPSYTLEVQPGTITLGRTDTNAEGGQLNFSRAGDNTTAWTIDQFGAGTSDYGSLRFFNTPSGTMRFIIDPTGIVGINTSAPNGGMLHIKGPKPGDAQGRLLKLEGSVDTWQGMVTKTADASPSAERCAFWEHLTENEAIVSAMHSWAYGDGSSSLYFQTTPAGSRTTTRKVDRLRLRNDGNTYISGKVGIGKDPDTTYGLAVQGGVSGSFFRAIQGVPNGTDASTNGYAFGADGDTGMFSPVPTGGTANAANGALSFFCNNSEKLSINATTTTCKQDFVVTGNLTVQGTVSQTTANLTESPRSTELVVQNTPNANQLRLIHGDYGVIQRNDGGDFYILSTASKDQTGSWNKYRSFAINLAAGHVYLAGTDGTTVPTTPTVIIGNATSGAKLAVRSNTDVILGLEGAGASQYRGMFIRTVDASTSAEKVAFWDHQNENGIQVGSMFSWAHTNNGSSLTFYTTPDSTAVDARKTDRRIKRMTINKDGRVGIGTDNLGSKLHVNGAITLEAENLPVLDVNVGSNNVDAGNLSNVYIQFAPAGSRNDWAYLRQIGGENAFHLALDLHDDPFHATAGQAFSIRNIGSSASTPDPSPDVLFIADAFSGNVGVGTASPTSKLHVNGTAKVQTSLEVGTSATVGTNLTVTGQVKAGSYFESLNSPTISNTGVVNLDLSLATDFTVVMDKNITSFNITNALANASNNFTLELVQPSSGGKTVAWVFTNKTIKWPDNSAPAVTSLANKSDIFGFRSRDGGTTWYGFVGGQNF